MRMNRRRIRETVHWPKGLWTEVVGRFTCPRCKAAPGQGCITTSGRETHTHTGRMTVASEAIVAALDAGEDPRKVGLAC